MSDTLENLRHKIDSAKELASVVRTMKALAAANITQFENAVRAQQAYLRTVELGLSVCLRELPLAQPIQAAKPIGERVVGVIVLGSDQGLVGQFNDVVAAFAARRFAKSEHVAQRLRVWPVGERVRDRLLEQGLTVQAARTVPTSVAGVTPLVTSLLAECEAQRVRGELDELHVVHNRPTVTVAYEQRSQQLLPLDEQWRARLIALPWPTGNLPELAPNGATPLVSLTFQYLFASLFQVAAESLASENASRLASMQRAESNIRDLLNDLNHTFHQLRQSAIDAELFDVLAGYEMLDKRSKHRLGESP